VSNRVVQLRREIPAFDRACRVAEQLRQDWPGPGRQVFMNAHCEEDVRQVSFVIRGGSAERAEADRVLSGLGYKPGWVSMMPDLDPPAWRKVIARQPT
jgi:hypothetical protein